MKIHHLLVAFALAAPFATTGCIFSSDDDDDDVTVDACETDCDDAHQECTVSCDNDSCVADCDTVREDCKLDCD